MRLAFYQCADQNCSAVFLGRSTGANEHCGQQAVYLRAEIDRCLAKQVVKLGTLRDVRRGVLGRSVPRRFWETTASEIVPESILGEFVQHQLDSPIVHVHLCTDADGHTGPHACTCDYEWS